MMRRPPRPTLFPYTTLFRSRSREAGRSRAAARTWACSAWPAAARSSAWRARAAASAGRTAGRATAAGTAAPSDPAARHAPVDRKSTRLNSSHVEISYAVFCLNDAPTPETYTLSLHDALPISLAGGGALAGGGTDMGLLRVAGGGAVVGLARAGGGIGGPNGGKGDGGGNGGAVGSGCAACAGRSEEHTSELQSRRDLVCRLLLE